MMKIITNENYGKPFKLTEPAKKIITDYQQWVIDIHPILPSARAAWDFQSNQIRYLETLIKDAAITIKGQKILLEDLKAMYEQLIADNYNQEMEIKKLKGE